LIKIFKLVATLILAAVTFQHILLPFVLPVQWGRIEWPLHSFIHFSSR